LPISIGCDAPIESCAGQEELVEVPRGNVETIRAFYEAWDRDDVPGFSRFLAEDSEFVSPPGAIDPGESRGPSAFAAVRRAVGERFGSFSHEIRDVRDARDRVLASVLFKAEGAEFRGRVEQPEFHVWTLRDGEIVRLAWFRTLDEAVEACGPGGL
jgi:ketosteroid isomerase-like protein